MRGLMGTILLLGVISTCQAQTGISLKQAAILPYDVAYFATGNTGELFIITPENQLKKYDANGDSVGVFNEVKKFGRLSSVEAQNPWKTILFYEDFATIVLLDKYLKITATIRLREKNIFGVKTATTSYDNYIWIFDPGDSKIKKIDNNGNILLSSTDLRQVMSSVPNPDQIIDNDGLLYLYDPNQGVFIFDYYGAFKSLLPYKGWDYLFVSGKRITGIDKKMLYQYTPPLPVATETELPPALQNASLMSISNRKLYVLKERILSVYNIE